MLKVISATPSPFARKVRIALIEKNVPFELVTDVPWNTDTTVGNFNPLAKLPILLTEKDGEIYDSALILDYIELTWPQPALWPADRMQLIRAKTIEVLQNGICDAVVLTFFERTRDEDKRSAEWLARQKRKIEGGTAALAEHLGGAEFFVGGSFTMADISAGSALGYLDLRLPEFGWRKLYPRMAAWFDEISKRESFKQTVPTTQKISSKVA